MSTWLEYHWLQYLVYIALSGFALSHVARLLALPLRVPVRGRRPLPRRPG